MDYKRLFEEAVKRDSDVRDAAFLELTTNICGIEIRQMTPRDFLILDGIGSPLLYGLKEWATLENVADFLWLMSASYRSGKWPAFWFARRCRKVNFGEATEGIMRYVEDTFQDAPGGKLERSNPFASPVAHWVHRFATEYGWPWREIIHTPFKILFQQMKCIRFEADAKAEVRSRRILKLAGERLRLKQQRLNLVNLLAKRARQN